MKFYVIEYYDAQNDTSNLKCGYFKDYVTALDYASNNFGNYDFTISEYENKQNYFNSL